MKKTMLFIFCAAFAAQACADVRDYTFFDACEPYIDRYCTGSAMVGDCMAWNWQYLDGDCSDAVFLWSGADRDHWHRMDPDARRDFVQGRHGADFTSHHVEGFRNEDGFNGGGFHGGGEFHGGGGRMEMRR
ncbi:MAG: hypothetical protein FWD33_03895 [Alphaproteobacteria bacterium]|nr:hypothetical protein [Alphaproteobacteria bacterium]